MADHKPKMAGQKKQVLTGDLQMEEKIVEFFAAFTAGVIFIGIVGFGLELFGSLVSVWKKILNK